MCTFSFSYFFSILSQNTFDVSQAVVVHKTQVEKQWNSYLKGFHFSVSVLLGSPKGHGTGCAVPCSIQDGQWEGLYTNLWLSQIVLSSAKFYCCTEWKQWWCVVTADCLAYMAVPMCECLPALILLGAFAMNFLHTNSFTRILSRYIEKRNCCLSVETLLMVKLWKG